MPLPTFQNLDTIGRPSNGGSMSYLWGQAVDDDINFLYGETSWTAPTFTNSWSSYGGGYDNVGFKLVGNTVFLRGALTGGTISATAFTLPAGYRPTGTKAFLCCNGSNAVALVSISSTGTVVVSTGTNGFVDLDQIQFQVV